MRKPKLLTATFEQSLNLENELTKWMSESIKVKKPVAMFIMSIVIIMFNYALTILSKSATERQFKDSPVPKAEINFLPEWLFFIFLTIFIIFWLYSHIFVKRYEENHFFWESMNGNNLTIWLFVEVISIFLTLFYFYYPLWIWLIIFGGVALLSIVMIKTQMGLLKNSMFKLNGQENLIKQSNIIKRIIQIASVIVSIYLIVRAIFPGIFKVTGGSSITIFLFTLAIPIMILIFVIFELYLVLPLILQNYYKIKYAEKYRKLESKTQIEWYGHNYYKKYLMNSPIDDASSDLEDMLEETETSKNANKRSKLLLINGIIGILLCIPILGNIISYLAIFDIVILVNAVKIIRQSRTNINFRKTSSVLMIVASIINIIGLIALLVYTAISDSNLVTGVSQEVIVIAGVLFYASSFVSWPFRIVATILAFIEYHKVSKLLKNKDKEDENE